MPPSLEASGMDHSPVETHCAQKDLYSRHFLDEIGPVFFGTKRTDSALFNKKSSSLMGWGCFSAPGNGQFYFSDGIFNAEKCTEILQKHMLISRLPSFTVLSMHPSTRPWDPLSVCPHGCSLLYLGSFRPQELFHSSCICWRKCKLLFDRRIFLYSRRPFFFLIC